ncbi:MAG: hypothetical protein CND00_00445 [Cryomorphaceae bacterium MED-G14]|nr:MAG: hypothetical protein CND00_00445 [Cryomorphaceae bacterium MED-G14]
MFVKKTYITIIQLSLSILFVYLTIYRIDIKSLVTIFNKIDLYFFLLSPIAYFISQIIASERLRNLLNISGFKLTFFENGKIYLIGIFYNFFVPGGIGGDIYKTYLFKKIYNWEVSQTIKIIIKDRLIGLGVLFILLVFLDNYLILKLNLFNKIILSLILFTMGSFITKVVFENNNGFVKSFFMSIAVQLFQFISIILILFSLKIDSNLVEILFVFIISSILSVFSFGGIGIREYVFFSAAYVLTISEELSTSIGLLFTISAVICSLPGFYFSIKKPK